MLGATAILIFWSKNDQNLHFQILVNFDVQNYILLKMQINVVLTFVPWKFNVEVVMTIKKIKDTTPYFTHKNKWFIIFLEGDGTNI